jgi:hypothetical protein
LRLISSRGIRLLGESGAESSSPASLQISEVKPRVRQYQGVAFGIVIPFSECGAVTKAGRWHPSGIALGVIMHLLSIYGSDWLVRSSFQALGQLSHSQLGPYGYSLSAIGGSPDRTNARRVIALADIVRYAPGGGSSCLLEALLVFAGWWR